MTIAIHDAACPHRLSEAVRATPERHDRFGNSHATLQFEGEGANCATRNLA